MAGLKEGRTSDSEVTMFDSTGLAIQDVITAWHAYRVGLEKGLGSEIPPLYLRGKQGVRRITATWWRVLRAAQAASLIACRYPNQGAGIGEVACGSGTVGGRAESCAQDVPGRQRILAVCDRPSRTAWVCLRGDV